MFLRRPDVGACRALGQFPVVLEEHVEIAVVPLDRVRRPGAFEARGDGVTALAGLVVGQPAEAHCLDRCAFRLGTDVRRIACAVHLAEGVTAGHQRDGLFVVHGHAREGLADVMRPKRPDRDCRWGLRGSRRSGPSAPRPAGSPDRGRPNSACHRATRLLAPVDVLLRLPHIFTTTGKSECLQPHRFQGHITRQHHQVRPGNLAAILLLNRPEQAAGLVEVDVVRPTIQRGETLRAIRCPTTPIRNTVRARAVPGHANEQRTVVAIVGRPPFLLRAEF
jgi:hypothetical protein